MKQSIGDFLLRRLQEAGDRKTARTPLVSQIAAEVQRLE
jgi:hypothetical protein